MAWADSSGDRGQKNCSLSYPDPPVTYSPDLPSTDEWEEREKLKKKLIITLAIFAVLILMVIILEGCVFTDPTKPVVELYEAMMKGDCQRAGELSKYDNPELTVSTCEKYRGKVTSYQIIGVERGEGIPGLLEWAAVKVRFEYTDRPPSEAKRIVTRQLFWRWYLTKNI